MFRWKGSIAVKQKQVDKKKVEKKNDGFATQNGWKRLLLYDWLITILVDNHFQISNIM